MQKVLFLSICLLASFVKDANAAAWQEAEANYSLNFNDSLIKGQVPTDPKEGFKDLFVRTTANGLNVNKLNPQAISFVQDYMSRYRSNLYKMKGWGKPYFDLMNGILAQHGLPVELKYLSVIESNLQTYAVSWAGAVGPWQFMPATARLMGLRVNTILDERTDFYKSTHAAARYLTQLYGQFGDWLLVIAAYNGGPGNVYSAMRRSHSRNFWDLQYYLPEESRNHVKKFIATHYIMEGDGGVTTLTKKETENFMLNEAMKPAATNDANTETMSISGKYNSLIIAQVIQMDIVSFNRMNPNFDKLLAANGTFDLRLPPDKMLLFQANKPQILEQSIRLMLTMN
jgi:membrane-bound lytic murein transglycosylase D